MNNKLTKLWNKYFDRIFVLTILSNDLSRLNKIIEELNRVGIYQTNKVEIFYTIKSNLKNNLFSYLIQNMDLCKLFKYSSVEDFDCVYNHYLIQLIAKTLEYNRILIIEDDARFLKDLDKIYEILSNFPEESNVVLFDKVNSNSNIFYENNTNSYYTYITKPTENWTGVCYSIDINAIKTLDAILNLITIRGIDLMLTTELLRYSLSNAELNKVSYFNTNLCIQDINLELQSKRLKHKPFYERQGININNYNI